MTTRRRRRIYLAVLVPLYNEEESVGVLYEGIRAVCELLDRPFEIIFVDDGSQDRTFAILEKIHAGDKRVRVIRLRRNYGQTAAMAAGVRAARGEVVVCMDGDLQNDPADIPRMLETLEQGYDVVCGWRKDRKDKLVTRRLPSIAANWLISIITKVPIHDNGCSLKAYRAKIIKRVPLYSEFHRFIPPMSTLAGARIAEVTVNHHPRRFGVSKYGIARAWRVFLDLFLIKLLTSCAARPGLWFGSLSLRPLLLGSFFLIESLAVGGGGIVFPVLGFLCLALTGHLLVLAVIGEMVLQAGDFRPEHMLVLGQP